MGLANMLSKENRAWWRTNRCWIQCLIWLFFLNGSMIANLANGQHPEDAVGNFLYVAGAVLPIGTILLGQESILKERQSGTAAWVLSKPIHRSAFLLAKLITYGLGFLVTAVVFPGVIGYFYITVVGKLAVPVAGFAGAMGLVYLNLLFYLTLTLMLATLFRGRGPVLGISLFVAWFFLLGEPAIWLGNFTPWWLLIPRGGFGDIPSLGRRLALGEPLPTLAPIIATGLWCVLFIVVILFRIRREEF
jgi:ABC-2 type transport system permease protein